MFDICTDEQLLRMTHSFQAEQIWSEVSGSLRSFIARTAPRGTDADDVLQDVFLRAQKHLPDVRDKDRVTAWLFQVTRNALTDTIRRRRSNDRVIDAASKELAPVGDDEASVNAEFARCMMPFVARLDEPYRKAIELVEINGLTNKVAAEQLGLSVSGMKSRVQRGREQLKTLLLECCEIQLDRRGQVIDFQKREEPCQSSCTNGCTESDS